jgi:hypothetical protein
MMGSKNVQVWRASDEMGKAGRTGMMMWASRAVVVCSVVCGVALLSAMVACEKTERGAALMVTPDVSSVNTAGQQVLLTASVDGAANAAISNVVNELLYPLVWSVSIPEYGQIISTAGNTAVYRCDTRHSRNVVTVHDQAQREGMAIIEWEETAEATSGL